MIVTMESKLTGKVNYMDIPVATERLNAYFSGGRKGLIQNWFPELSADQREFLITGSTPEEWEAAFGEEA
jgi:hypothetical protein